MSLGPFVRRIAPLVSLCMVALALRIGPARAQDGGPTDGATSQRPAVPAAAEQGSVSDTDAEREADHAEQHGEPTRAELAVLRDEIAAAEREEHAMLAAERAAAEASGSARGASPRRRANSRSIGNANRGFLRNAVAIESSETIHIKRSAMSNRYGTAELVTLIEHGAATVARTQPGSRLAVGDLSQRGGGRLRPHRSHRSGRDVDLGFYMLDANGRAIGDAGVFVRMGDDGFGERRGTRYAFDVARNWTFVEAVITHPQIHAQYIFVARALITTLLTHAATIGAPAAHIDRAGRVLHQPSRGAPHRGHFHLRIYCPADDRPACVDDPPFHPWMRAPSAPAP